MKGECSQSMPSPNFIDEYEQEFKNELTNIESNKLKFNASMEVFSDFREKLSFLLHFEFLAIDTLGELRLS